MLALHPAAVGDLVMWPKPIDKYEAWFVALVHGVDEEGFVNLVNFRGAIRDIEDLCPGERTWEIAPREIMANDDAVRVALETTWASRNALAQHLKPHTVCDREEALKRIYFTRRADLRAAQECCSTPAASAEDAG